MSDLVSAKLGQHRLPSYPRSSAAGQKYEVVIGQHRITMERPPGSPPSSFWYRRHVGEESRAEAMIVSKEDPAAIGIFPVVPLFTPKSVAKNLYLKFRSPVVVDQRGEVEVLARMPIEIGVYRQSRDEEILLDAFSLRQPQYALYGSPESGVVCRYYETDVGTDAAGEGGEEEKKDAPPAKYEEARVRITIKNDIDNVVKVSRVVIPLAGVILDHAHDDSWLPGSVEMYLGSAFGKDVVNVRYPGAKVKRADKTSVLRREETLAFLMDAGY